MTPDLRLRPALTAKLRTSAVDTITRTPLPEFHLLPRSGFWRTTSSESARWARSVPVILSGVADDSMRTRRPGETAGSCAAAVPA